MTERQAVSRPRMSRRRGRTLALLLAGVTAVGAATGVALFAAQAARAAVSPTTWYTVVNKNSGKCVDACAAATPNGTAVQQYTCDGTTAQQWQFQTTANGDVRVDNGNNAAQVWDVTNVSTADGALIQLWAYGGGTNQQW